MKSVVVITVIVAVLMLLAVDVRGECVTEDAHLTYWRQKHGNITQTYRLTAEYDEEVIVPLFGSELTAGSVVVIPDVLTVYTRGNGAYLIAAFSGDCFMGEAFVPAWKFDHWMSTFTQERRM